MRTPLITEYKTLIVYLIIHASMPLNLNNYKLKQYSPHHKILGQPHGKNPANAISHC